MSNTSAITRLLTGAFFILVIPIQTVFSQSEEDSVWTNGGNIGLFLQQVGVKNWSGGGESSMAYGGEVNLFANKDTDKSSWENGLQAGYGLIKQGEAGTRKNNDVLILTSKYGRNLRKKLQMSAGIDIRTQFSDGFIYEGKADGTDSLISAFMAPGYISPYLGFTCKPKKSFSLTLSPLMNKFTFVLDEKLSNRGAYGVDPGDNVRSQLGWSFNASYQKEIMTNVNLKTNLLLFTAYNELRHVDVNYDLFLNFKVNQLISANISFQAIYDHDVKIEDEDGSIGPKTQLRNTINIGFNFNFGDSVNEE